MVLFIIMLIVVIILITLFWIEVSIMDKLASEFISSVKVNDQWCIDGILGKVYVKILSIDQDKLMAIVEVKNGYNINNYTVSLKLLYEGLSSYSYKKLNHE